MIQAEGRLLPTSLCSHGKKLQPKANTCRYRGKAAADNPRPRDRSGNDWAEEVGERISWQRDRNQGGGGERTM